MKLTKELIQASINLGHYRSHERSCDEGGGAHGEDEHTKLKKYPPKAFEALGFIEI